MKKIVLTLLCCLAAPVYGAECKKNITENEAIVIAEKYLSEQDWNNQFQKKAEKSSMLNCEWIVWFKNVKWEEVKPSRGKVSVSIETGKVIWLPSR